MMTPYRIIIRFSKYIECKQGFTINAHSVMVSPYLIMFHFVNNRCFFLV